MKDDAKGYVWCEGMMLMDTCGVKDNAKGYMWCEGICLV